MFLQSLAFNPDQKIVNNMRSSRAINQTLSIKSCNKNFRNRKNFTKNMQKVYKNYAISKINQSKRRESRELHNHKIIRTLLCVHARTGDSVPQLMEGGKLSLDTIYKFSCDYSYISSFYRHIRIFHFWFKRLC